MNDVEHLIVIISSIIEMKRVEGIVPLLATKVEVSNLWREDSLDDVIEECINLGLIRQGETINSKYYILNEDKTGN